MQKVPTSRTKPCGSTQNTHTYKLPQLTTSGHGLLSLTPCNNLWDEAKITRFHRVAFSPFQILPVYYVQKHAAFLFCFGCCWQNKKQQIFLRPAHSFPITLIIACPMILTLGWFFRAPKSHCNRELAAECPSWFILLIKGILALSIGIDLFVIMRWHLPSYTHMHLDQVIQF